MEPKPSTLREYARRLRQDQTDAERKLWARLRSWQVNGAKFRRQHPIGCYIVDFCCIEQKLVVELDGGHHSLQIQADHKRTESLIHLGYRVLRFWDNEVLQNMDAVLEQIAELLKAPR